MRVTTVRFGAPRSQAAGCLIRLQLPPSPSTRAGGGQRPPPPGERNEKVRDVTQGGKKMFTVAVQIPAREGVRPVSGRAVPCGTALQAATGNPSSTVPSKIAATGTRTAGARTLGLAGRSPRGGSVELLGTAGMRPSPGRGSTSQPACGLGRAGGCCASSISDGGQPSWQERPVPAPGTSQRWMWPLGSPDGSGSFLVFRARRRAGFVWAWTVLGRAAPSRPSRLSHGRWASRVHRGSSPLP